MYNYRNSIITACLLCVVLFRHIQHVHTLEGMMADVDGLASDAQSVRSRNTYDFIVVGVGMAGSVVCGRLTESKKYTVLGIEAGGKSHRSLGGTDYVTSSFSRDANGQIVVNTPFTRFDVPLFFPSTYVQPTPYSNFQVVRNGVLQTGFVAKILGGSGAHNGMLWSRMTKQNVDSWGVQGWSWDDVLPFYKKSENVTGSRAAAFPSYHGFSGPIQISDIPTTAFYSEVPPFVASCVKTGLPNNTDFNGPTRLGCGTQQFNIRRGVRDSSAQAYLPQALETGKLKLSLDSQVNKILFETRRDGSIYAAGVEYVQNNVTKRAYARKDIILSLSAILTPKLLQLSGIGPATLLRRYGIPVVVDNAYVGRNLSNNQFIGGSWEFPNATTPNGWRISDYTQEYALYGTGPLSFPASFGHAYACSKKVCDQPDVLVGTTAGIFLAGSPTPTLATNINNCYPKSRGVVSIASANPNDPPIIDMPVYENEADVNSTIYGFRLLRQILTSSPANTIIGREITPGAAVQTDQQFRDYILKNGIPNAHYSGTTRVGNYGASDAVVDPRLRVFGVKGLRVGDTSICHTTNSHTQASAVMVGERVAAFALEDAAANI